MMAPSIQSYVPSIRSIDNQSKSMDKLSYDFCLEKLICPIMSSWPMEYKCEDEGFNATKTIAEAIEKEVWGWFFGPLVFMITLLLLVMNYRDETTKSGRKKMSPMQSLSEYFTKKIPLTTFMFVMMGIAFSIYELKPVKEFMKDISELKCIDQKNIGGNNDNDNYNYNMTWWGNPVKVGVMMTLLAHKSFWNSMSKFIENAAMEETCMGTYTFFAFLLILVLLSSLFEVILINAIDLKGSFFFSLFDIEPKCEDKGTTYFIDGGISDIVAGLVLFQNFMVLEKFQHVTTDPNRQSQVMDILFMFIVEVTFLAMPWNFYFVSLLLSLWALSLLKDYNRQVTWKGSLEFGRIQMPLNEILGTRFYVDEPSKLKAVTDTSSSSASSSTSQDVRNTATGASLTTFAVEHSMDVSKNANLLQAEDGNINDDSEDGDNCFTSLVLLLWGKISYFVSLLSNLLAKSSKKDQKPAEFIISKLLETVFYIWIFAFILLPVLFEKNDTFFSKKCIVFSIIFFSSLVSKVFYHKDYFFHTILKKMVDFIKSKFRSSEIQLKAIAKVDDTSRGSYSDTSYIITRIFLKFQLYNHKSVVGILSGVLAAFLIWILTKVARWYVKRHDPQAGTSLHGSTSSSHSKPKSFGAIMRMFSFLPRRQKSEEEDVFLRDMRNKKLTQEDFNMMFFLDDVREGLWFVLTKVWFVLTIFIPAKIVSKIENFPSAVMARIQTAWGNSGHAHDDSSNKHDHGHDKKVVSREPVTRAEKIQERGEYFGYPKCCINEHIDLLSKHDGKYPETDPMYRLCVDVSVGTEFIPCLKHAKEIANCLTLDKLIRGRKCPRPFPHDDFEVKNKTSLTTLKKVDSTNSTRNGTSTDKNTGSSLIRKDTGVAVGQEYRQGQGSPRSLRTASTNRRKKE